MQILIRGLKTKHQIRPFSLLIRDGCILEIHYKKMDGCQIVIPIQQTSDTYWYKIYIINQILIDWETKVIEWSFKTVNPRKTFIKSGSINLTKINEFESFFKKLNHKLKRKTFDYDGYFKDIAEFIISYILPRINFKNARNIVEEICKDHLESISKLKQEIKKCKIILRKNISENKNWLLAFISTSVIDQYDKIFLEQICDDIELIINDVTEEIQHYQKKINIALEEKDEETFKINHDLRKQFYEDIFGFLKIKDKVFQIYNMKKTPKHFQLSGLQQKKENMKIYKTISLNVGESRRILEEMYTCFKNANKLKVDLNECVIELETYEGALSINKSLLNRGIGRLLDIGSTDDVVEEIHAIFRNSLFPMEKCSKDFCQKFSDSCHNFFAVQKTETGNTDCTEILESSTISNERFENYISQLQALKNSLYQHFQEMWMQFKLYATIDTETIKDYCF